MKETNEPAVTNDYVKIESGSDFKVDDTKETVYTFLDKIARAKGNDEEWVETSPQIIQHYNRRGMNGARFFIYDGIKVCETGKRVEIEAEEQVPMGVRIHGKGEGVRG